MTTAQRAELDNIAQANNGLLVPEKVVEFAADATSALHNEFTWDNEEAARKLREQQARQLIRVYIKFVPAAQRKTRAFISVPSDRANGDGYRRTEDVIANPMLMEQMVDEVRKRIASLSQSYSYLRFLDPLWPILQADLERFLVESRSAGAA